MATPLSKAKLSSYRALHRKKFREAENRFLIEGWHLLEEALNADVPIRALIVDETRALSPKDQSVRRRAQSQADETFSATLKQLQSLAGTVSCQGVVAAIDRTRWEWEGFQRRFSSGNSGFLVFLDGVSDPGNCGSIIRSCDWFGVDGVVMGGGCAELENGKLVRATMGSLFHLPIASVESIVEHLVELKKQGYQVVASGLGKSLPMTDYRWPQKTVLVIGNEARGVSDSVLSIADTRLRIPKFGQAESLNAAMATSIMLSHWRCSSGEPR